MHWKNEAIGCDDQHIKFKRQAVFFQACRLYQLYIAFDSKRFNRAGYQLAAPAGRSIRLGEYEGGCAVGIQELLQNPRGKIRGSGKTQFQ